MPLRPVPCDLGDPGGGDPWFPHGTLLLHSLAGMAWWFWCFDFWWVCHTNEMIQCYHLLHQLIFRAWTGYLSHRFGSGFAFVVLGCVGFLFVCWFVFCFVVWFLLVSVSVLCWCFRQNAGLCIGPFPVHFMRLLIWRQPAYAVINQLILLRYAFEHVERPGESHEGVGRKKGPWVRQSG